MRRCRPRRTDIAAGRTISDRNKTLWASFAVEQLDAGGNVTTSIWFGGDTGYRTKPKDVKDIDSLPVCPAFKEIGEKFSARRPFDLVRRVPRVQAHVSGLHPDRRLFARQRGRLLQPLPRKP